MKELIEKSILFIKENEGFRKLPYKDTKGYLTIGYGTRLGVGINKDCAEYIMLNNANGILDIIKSLESNPFSRDIWSNLDTIRKIVIIDMTYNMGIPAIFKFKKMWRALGLKDYDRASKEILDSKYAKDVKSRAVRNANIMRWGNA